jgi:alkaline phosphatase
MAAHDNDPSTQVGETLAYDDAFAVVRDFVDKRANRTLVVASSDHETGGLSLGFDATMPLGGIGHLCLVPGEAAPPEALRVRHRARHHAADSPTPARWCATTSAATPPTPTMQRYA